MRIHYFPYYLVESNVVEEHGEALLAIALKYQVVGLIQLCEAHFAAQLSEDNVVELLLLADGINSIRLKEKALQLIGNTLTFFKKKTT